MGTYLVAAAGAWWHAAEEAAAAGPGWRVSHTPPRRVGAPHGVLLAAWRAFMALAVLPPEADTAAVEEACYRERPLEYCLVRARARGRRFCVCALVPLSARDSSGLALLCFAL